MPELISFAAALDETEGERRHLLIGNGFSISLFPDCFRYASLFQEAKDGGLFEKHPELLMAFELLETTDFELVMETLQRAAKLGPLYGFDKALMEAHAELLKDVLVQAIAGRHPSRPSEISEEQYQNCRAFLANFIGGELEKPGKIFSLNYDLLLYWSILHDIFSIDWGDGGFSLNPDQVLGNDDGFRAPEDDYDAEYVAWEQYEASKGQTITFLHGALHLYQRGSELAKLCWERAGNKPLMDQIRAALDENRFPLFVSEGNTEQKLARINNNAYLAKGLRSFAECCKSKQNSIFVIGHSLADNDEHVLKRIRKGGCGRLYVSIFGDVNDEWNKAVVAKAEAMALARPAFKPLELKFIDAETLHIWNH
ncbi:MAG: DUF4917 family protein [Erythrobacter sp.]|nr:DUF4917 family protein [Erythrobacter sp.]